MRIWAIMPAALAAVGAATAPARAADAPAHQAAVIRDLGQCRALTDDTARLACYDRAVTGLLAAEQRNDVVIVDREQVQQTRRSLFGLALPRLAIFSGHGGNDNHADEELDHIETTLSRADRQSDGRWFFVLADGARWRQIDDYDLFRTPHSGDPITIFRAALGSFKLKVGNSPAVRVRREN